MITPASDLETLVTAGTALTRSQAEALLASPDLIGVGSLGELARRSVTRDTVTFCRVLPWPAPGHPRAAGGAGEIRIVSRPQSAADARAAVQDAVALAGSILVSGFSLADLLRLTGGDHLALADLARALRADGLRAVAEVPLDELGDTDNAIEAVRAAQHGGLAAGRATVTRAPIGDRLDLIDRAVAVQAETRAFRAFAPLPRVDAVDTPATGYDDVRTVAIARLMCRTIELIQVDWPLYGPKLAQVAIAYGANDIDGVAALDEPALGPRRSPVQDIERQIRAAGATPVERDGRYEHRA